MNIILGVTGGIAAYKAAGLIRKLQAKGHDVKVVMTENAQKFITPLTLAVLSKHPVMTTMWADRSDVEHIDVCKWADVLLVYPATANIIGKFANGIADDLLSTVFLAMPKDKRIIVCPAMNSNMWLNPIVQNNVQGLFDARVEVVDPVQGDLACGDNAVGKVASDITALL